MKHCKHENIMQHTKRQMFCTDCERMLSRESLIETRMTDLIAAQNGVLKMQKELLKLIESE